MSASHPIPARGETTPDTRPVRDGLDDSPILPFPPGFDPATRLPVEPAGTPEGTVSERFHQYLHDLLRAYAKSRSLPIGSGQAANEAGTALSLALVRVKNLFAEATTSAYTVTEATRALRAENTELSDRCAALTSEVSRLQKNWDEAYEVHESDKIEIIDLRAEVSALREAVDADKARLDWLDARDSFDFEDFVTAWHQGVSVREAIDIARRDGAP